MKLSFACTEKEHIGKTHVFIDQNPPLTIIGDVRNDISVSSFNKVVLEAPSSLKIDLKGHSSFP